MNATDSVIIDIMIESLLHNYSENFNRPSESMCRTAIEMMLNKCLTVMVSWLEIFSKTC